MPLMYAAAYNANHEVTKVLIDAGADVNTGNIFGMTPLILATALPSILRRCKFERYRSLRIVLHSHISVAILQLIDSISFFMRLLSL